MPVVEDYDAEHHTVGNHGAEEITDSDPIAALVESSKNEDIYDDEEEDIDETVSERLFALTEMFPERLRSVSSKLTSFTWSSTKWLYGTGRAGMWIVGSSAVLLALPVMFETERAQMEEQQLQQQRQMLLGPNAAVSGGSGLMPGAMPQVMPPSR